MERPLHLRVLIAPDSFGGTLSPVDAADAIARGWSQARPDDNVVVQPLSDGGEGLLEVVGAAADEWQHREVAGPLGRPVDAPWILESRGEAIVESARACGLSLVPPDRRDPLMTTTWGVGELVDVARAAGAERILVGLGGSATVDGGAGAVSALGARVLVADGSGLKVGGGQLHRVARVEEGWMADWHDVDVVLLADVTTVLADAAARFGPQKGADEQTIDQLERGLAAWADAVEKAFDVPGLRDEPGSGAAGGLGFGLAAATGGRIVAGADAIADRVGLDELVAAVDLVVTGEGRLDETSLDGKVVGHVVERAEAAGTSVAAVCGQTLTRLDVLRDIEAASPNGLTGDPSTSVAAAAERLASRI